MGLFHGVEHYEKLKVTDESDVELFKSTWSQTLNDNFQTRYDWSYIVAWVGVGMCLGSSILFSMSALCIKSDKEREEAMNMQYLMPGKIKNFGFFRKSFFGLLAPKRLLYINLSRPLSL